MFILRRYPALDEHSMVEQDNCEREQRDSREQQKRAHEIYSWLARYFNRRVIAVRPQTSSRRDYKAEQHVP